MSLRPNFRYTYCSAFAVVSTTYTNCLSSQTSYHILILLNLEHLTQSDFRGFLVLHGPIGVDGSDHQTPTHDDGEFRERAHHIAVFFGALIFQHPDRVELRAPRVRSDLLGRRRQHVERNLEYHEQVLIVRVQSNTRLHVGLTDLRSQRSVPVLRC